MNYNGSYSEKQKVFFKNFGVKLKNLSQISVEEGCYNLICTPDVYTLFLQKDNINIEELQKRKFPIVQHFHIVCEYAAEIVTTSDRCFLLRYVDSFKWEEAEYKQFSSLNLINTKFS